MMIEIPRVYIDIFRISIDPKTFIPQMDILINKTWTESLREKYFIIDFNIDDSGDQWAEQLAESAEMSFRFTEGDQTDNDRVAELTSWYFNQRDKSSVRAEFIVNVIEKNKISLRDIFSILARRYHDILVDKVGIDDKLDKMSNTNLSWMTTEILNNQNMPCDKVSRWIGFIQGCMSMKGYLDVDSERDFSREYFHAYYQQNNLSIDIVENTQGTELFS